MLGSGSAIRRAQRERDVGVWSGRFDGLSANGMLVCGQDASTGSARTECWRVVRTLRQAQRERKRVGLSASGRFDRLSANGVLACGQDASTGSARTECWCLVRTLRRAQRERECWRLVRRLTGSARTDVGVWSGRFDRLSANGMLACGQDASTGSARTECW